MIALDVIKIGAIMLVDDEGRGNETTLKEGDLKWERKRLAR